MSSNRKDQNQLMVKFFTKNQKYSVSDNPYSIASDSNIEILNSLIKSIIKDDRQTNDDEQNNEDLLLNAEFDFYVKGQPLTTNLDDLIKQIEDIKIESLIEIEYVERHPAPEPIDTIITDDWVSSIRGLNDCILLGSYDHTVQIWNRKGECLANLPGHTGAVKAVSWLSIDKNEYKFLSSSHDNSIIVWNWNKNKNKVEKADKCVGHSESVDCIDVNKDKTKFISGSWDKMLKLWSLTDDLPDESINKKKKSDLSVTTRTPIITLPGHTEAVSSCKWIDEKNACTASWDHSIKLWDVYVGQETQTLKSSNKIFLSVDYSPLKQLIAAGLNDSYVRLYDPKSNEGNLVKIQLSSHSGWITSVFWCLNNENLLVSGSYDMKAKLWDIRNTKSSLFDMIGHEDKVLCVDWSIENLILTGSSDNSFKMYKA